MSEFVQPDKIHQIPMEDGTLDLCVSYDVLHRWERLGFTMLKYWDQPNHTMCNVPINEAGAQFLIDECGIGVVDRPTMGHHEHEIYLSWSADQLEGGYDEE